MKRIITVIVIIVLMIGLSTAALVHLITATDQMQHTLDQILEAVEQNKIGQVQNLTDQFQKQWTKNENIMTRYIHHDELDLIHGIVARLAPLIRYNDIAEYTAEVERLRELIWHIRESEIPSLKNIF